MKNIVWDDDIDDIKQPQNPPVTGDEDVKSYEPGKKSGGQKSAGTSASTVRYGSAGGDSKLQEKINGSSIKLGGGKLFRYTDANGLHRVGFAVSGMDDKEAEGLCGKYETLCDDSSVGFLAFDRAFRVNDQWVFAFKLPYDDKNAVCVYDMVHGVGEGPVLSGDRMLAQLVQILINHRSRFTENEYMPLRCISPHTVFLLRSPRGQVSVRLLPLILSGNFPGQVPNDSKPDVTTDVYSACYLACEVLSGGFADEGVAIREPSELIRRAMAPFPGWRPGLKAFAEELELDHVGPLPRNKEKIYNEKSDGYGIFTGLSQMFSDLFSQNKADHSEHHTPTWRDEA